MPPTDFELLFVLQPLLHRNDVDRLLAVVHLREQLVDDLMTQIIKDTRALLEFFDALSDALVRREKYAAKHPLLRLGECGGKRSTDDDGTRSVADFFRRPFRKSSFRTPAFEFSESGTD